MACNVRFINLYQSLELSIDNLKERVKFPQNFNHSSSSIKSFFKEHSFKGDTWARKGKAALTEADKALCVLVAAWYEYHKTVKHTFTSRDTASTVLNQKASNDGVRYIPINR